MIGINLEPAGQPAGFFVLDRQRKTPSYHAMTLALPYTAQIGLNGPDTVTLLERLVTCRVDDMRTGDARPGALLTPQGKILSDFYLTRTETGFDLRVHADIAGALEKRLKMFRLRADVEITSAQLSSAMPDHTARIAEGLPAFGADFDTGEVFPTDVNLDIRGGIDYKKGCFVGQEVVSRMKRRGKIRKRSVVLTGAGLETGAPIMAGAKRLGYVTSASDTNALAVLRIDHLSDALGGQTPLTCHDMPVTAHLTNWLSAEMEALSSNGDI